MQGWSIIVHRFFKLGGLNGCSFNLHLSKDYQGIKLPLLFIDDSTTHVFNSWKKYFLPFSLSHSSKVIWLLPLCKHKKLDLNLKFKLRFHFACKVSRSRQYFIYLKLDLVKKSSFIASFFSSIYKGLKEHDWLSFISFIWQDQSAFICCPKRQPQNL